MTLKKCNLAAIAGLVVLLAGSHIFANQAFATTDDEETATLSQETTLKIQELERLMYRYSQYHRNPGAVINCIIYYCNNGDNTLLDEKLEQLRTFDSAMGHPRFP